MPRDLKPKNGRPSHSDFAKFVEGLPLPKSLLGLTHITSSYLLRDIVESGAIQAYGPCKIIGENLTYAFYGRAAFRGSAEFEPASLPCLFPSVLVLDPSAVPQPKYVFGFDSGAFVEGMMDPYLHPYMPLFDFLLAPDASSAAKLIGAVFETPDDYFRNRPSTKFQVPPSNFEAQCYKAIVQSAAQGAGKLDDRASTPELLFADAIELGASVRAAVLPDTLASDPNIGGALKGYGVEVHEYPWTSSSRPGENHFVVRQLVQSIYKEREWL